MQIIPYDFRKASYFWYGLLSVCILYKAAVNVVQKVLAKLSNCRLVDEAIKNKFQFWFSSFLCFNFEMNSKWKCLQVYGRKSTKRWTEFAILSFYVAAKQQ